MVFLSDGADELTRLPFAPGEAPFRVKGTAYRGHLEYTEANVRGGVAKMLESFDDPRMRRFFEQPFLAASLYDVFPLAIAGIVCGRLNKQRFLEFVRVRSIAQAKSDMTGAYRVMLALASPEAVASRIPRLIAQYFDFGETIIVEKGRGKVAGVRTGVPAALAPWYTTVTSAYGRVVIQTAGGIEPHFETVRVEPDGTRAGVPLVKLEFELTWR